MAIRNRFVQHIGILFIALHVIATDFAISINCLKALFDNIDSFSHVACDLEVMYHLTVLMLLFPIFYCNLLL